MTCKIVIHPCSVCAMFLALRFFVIGDFILFWLISVQQEGMKKVHRALLDVGLQMFPTWLQILVNKPLVPAQYRTGGRRDWVSKASDGTMAVLQTDDSDTHFDPVQSVVGIEALLEEVIDLIHTPVALYVSHAFLYMSVF